MKKIISFLFLLIISNINYAQTEIERIEPPNWWVGMEYNEVELLIYGQNISEFTPKIEYQGVSLISHKSLQSPNYLFVTITINKDAEAGLVPIILEGKMGETITNNYEMKERKEDIRNIEGFNSSDVMYLITPDRFSNGDHSNDILPGMRETSIDRSNQWERHGGDIKGIMNHLKYIKELGFTSIWLNPIIENDMERNSYHGYAATDFYKVDARFGTNENYKELCDLARANDMKVIMDMIINHCGSFHWWMDDLPSEDWINQWPEYTQTNHKKTSILDPYATAEDKKIFTDGWFVKTMPDINQRNESVGKYFIQNSIWWIEYLGIAGIRMDTYSYPDMNYMAEWTEAIMQEYPNFNIVGEEWNLEPTIVSYWQAGKENANGYSSSLKSVMDFPLQNAFITALKTDNTWNSSWNKVYEMLGQDYLYPDPMNLLIFPDNHDMSRIHAQLENDVAKTKIAIAYFATTRGIPQFYYGTEILMADSTGSHGEIRSDFPGGWKGDEVNVKESKGLSAEQLDFLNYMKKILNWRKTSSVIHKGQTKHFAPKRNDLYVYLRYDENDVVMVILNKNKKEVTLEIERYLPHLLGKTKAREIISDKNLDLTTSTKIPGMSAYILDFY